MKSRQSWIAVLLAVALAFVGLAGCSALGEPSTTEALLVRYEANENNDNFAADATIDLGLAVSGFRTRLPIAASVTTAGGSAHGTVDVDLSSLSDTGGKLQFELYAEATDDHKTLVWYVKEKNGALWARSEVDLTFAIDIPLIVKVLSESKFLRIAYDADEQVAYELIVPAAVVADMLLGEGEVTTSFGEVDQAAIDKFLGDSRIHLRFTKDCLVRSIFCNLSFTCDDKGVAPVPIAMDLGIEATMDKYGKIDAASVAVPGEVRDRSYNTDNPLNVDGVSDQVIAALV